jgi:hypothetical protein
MCAVGAHQIPRRSWRAAAIATVCVLSLASSISVYVRVREDWRGVIHYLAAHADREDRVLYCDPVSFRAAESYRDWLEDGNKERPPAVIADGSNNNWEKRTESAGRIWLVLYQGRSDPQALRMIDETLQNRFAASPPMNFGTLTITEYHRKPN